MTKICEQTGKHIHSSKGKAITHQRKLHEKTGYQGNPFHCEFCGAWHIGRPKEKAHKNKYKKS